MKIKEKIKMKYPKCSKKICKNIMFKTKLNKNNINQKMREETMKTIIQRKTSFVLIKNGKIERDQTILKMIGNVIIITNWIQIDFWSMNK